MPVGRFKYVIAVGAVLLVLLTFYRLMISPPSISHTTSPSPTTTLRPQPTWRPPLPGTIPAAIQALRDLDSANPEGIQKAATDLRARCRTDKDLMRALIARLHDPNESPHVREIAAFVLASLRDPEAQGAIREALEAATDPRWIRLLIWAAGSARDSGKDLGFSYADGPYIKKTDSGLGVEIRTVLLDPGLLQAVTKHFGHSEESVRHAAIDALEHTLAYEADSLHRGAAAGLQGLREQFLHVMSSDQVEEVRAHSASALAQWMVRAPAQSDAMAQVRSAVLEKFLDREEDLVRFRTEQALKQVPLSASELNRVLETALNENDFDLKTYAMQVAGTHARDLDPAQQASTQEAFARMATEDSDAKVREFAVKQLPYLPLQKESQQTARDALRDSAWHVRAAAVESLMEFPPCPENLAALEQIRQSDPNEDVRKRAAEALEYLRKKSE